MQIVSGNARVHLSANNKGQATSKLLQADSQDGNCSISAHKLLFLLQSHYLQAQVNGLRLQPASLLIKTG